MKHQSSLPIPSATKALRSTPEIALLSISQTAQLSGVSEDDLLGLIEYGVLAPTSPDSEPRTFGIDCVMKLQRAELMRQDLALDSHGFALALMFLNQITGLEEQLYSTQCDLRDYLSQGPLEHQRG